MRSMLRLAWGTLLLGASLRAQISAPVLGYVPVGMRVRVMHGIPAAGRLDGALDLDRGLSKVAVSPRQDYFLGVDAAGAVEMFTPRSGIMTPIAGASANPDAIVVSPGGQAAALVFASQNRAQVITGLPASPVVRETGALIDKYSAVSDNGMFISTASPVAFFHHSDQYVDSAGAAFVAVTSDDQNVVRANPDGTIALVNLADGAEADFDCGCRVTGLFALGNSVFRLNGAGLREDLTLFDAVNRRMLVVPVAGSCRWIDSSSWQSDATPAPIPAVTIAGLPASSGPAQQPAMTISIASAYSADINGTATLAFTSGVGGDDQTIQFTNGSRTATFTIPAGSTAANFSGKANIGVMTGTVSGTITIKLTLSVNGTDVTPSPAPSASIATLATVPFIQLVQMVQTSGGFEVHVTGFSSARDMSSGTFHFAPSSNATLAGEDVTVQLGGAFSSWYSNTASNAFGSQFLLVVPFTTQNGPPGDIVAVTVTLANSKGASNPVVNQ